MKKLLAILCFLACIACNKSKYTTPYEGLKDISVTGAITHEVLNEKLSCHDNEYSFALPHFNSGTAADVILNQPIIGLITQDFIDVTYERNAPLTAIYDTFINRRKRILCHQSKKQGLRSIETVFVTDNDKFISYELEYQREHEKGRLLKTFLKPELKDLKLSDIIPPEKANDVKLIFDANLQQAVAHLVSEIEDITVQKSFIEHVRNTAFQFKTEDFENAGLAFEFDGELSKNLRLAKQVALPKEFEFLNNTVIIEIDAYQLSHYLDLSRIIN